MRRIEAEVRKEIPTESGMILRDKNNKSYHWKTKVYSHDLWFTDDFLKVKMTIVHEDEYGTTVKNVRLIK